MRDLSLLISHLLKEYWGYDSFRGVQKEIIESVCAGRDTLGLMPTGGGKSITFQVPALVFEGVCVVITPLIALMKDQVQHLRRKGIRAAAIYSDMSRDSIVQTLENAIFGGVKLLYVSPERLSSELFRTKLRHMQVSFICVDEAHCISQWGYDFRPSYLEIADIRKDLPDAPVLALTATATPDVVDDIQERLAFREKNVFKMSFERKNLAYIVRHTTDKLQQLTHILNCVEGSSIVYARSRRRTKEISDYLNEQGFSSDFFHAGLDSMVKDARQRDWQEGRKRIIVATNAFGMGIDKPDVRTVIHMDCPSSIEAYYQEAGRAGRDGKKAYAILLYNDNDHAKLQKRIADTFPEKNFIRQVYDQLAYFYQIATGSGYNSIFEFPIDKFCATYKHFPVQVDSALKILDRAGYIEYMEEQDNQARVMFCLERDDLYRLHGNTKEEDQIIIALLRSYSGLFNDYVYIDETFLSSQTGIKQTFVYQTLKGLSQKRILKFIPQKRTPFIRYRQRREESQHLIFPPAVYEDLRNRFAQRINAILQYIETDNQCRSRQLLRYFGEKRSQDCGQCDVCTDRKGTLTAQPLMEDARQQIMHLLSDRKQHPLSELHTLQLPDKTLQQALQHLIDEAIVTDDDGMLSLD
jgi:ATP-dependent DNA helicase RecQ